jgi:hypothetical protein
MTRRGKRKRMCMKRSGSKKRGTGRGEGKNYEKKKENPVDIYGHSTLIEIFTN